MILENIRKRSRYLGLSGIIFLLDQLTKYGVSSELAYHSTLVLIPNILNFTHVQNTGGVFGLFATVPPWGKQVLFLFIPVCAIGFILFYQHQLPASAFFLQTGLGFVLGGAIGNFFDRLRLGYVVDFIDVHWYTYHWPAFNLADSAICVGVGFLILDMFWHSADQDGLPERL